MITGFITSINMGTKINDHTGFIAAMNMDNKRNDHRLYYGYEMNDQGLYYGNKHGQ